MRKERSASSPSLLFGLNSEGIAVTSDLGEISEKTYASFPDLQENYNVTLEVKVAMIIV